MLHKQEPSEKVKRLIHRDLLRIQRSCVKLAARIGQPLACAYVISIVTTQRIPSAAKAKNAKERRVA